MNSQNVALPDPKNCTIARHCGLRTWGLISQYMAKFQISGIECFSLREQSQLCRGQICTIIHKFLPVLVEGTRGQTPTILTWDKSWTRIEAKTSVEKCLASFVEVLTSEFVCMYMPVLVEGTRGQTPTILTWDKSWTRIEAGIHISTLEIDRQRQRERVVRDGRELRGMVKSWGLLYLGN